MGVEPWFYMYVWISNNRKSRKVTVHSLVTILLVLKIWLGLNWESKTHFKFQKSGFWDLLLHTFCHGIPVLILKTLAEFLFPCSWTFLASNYVARSNCTGHTLQDVLLFSRYLQLQSCTCTCEGDTKMLGCQFPMNGLYSVVHVT